ncbi:MAG: DUF2634 domain-containing protein [Filifactoraceae bacterium]
MLPENDGLLRDFKIKEIPSVTYKLGSNTISGLIDEKEALIQSIELMLNIERYTYAIYSKNYGSELSQLTGENIRLAYSQIENYIRDALSIDNRIVELKDFKFSYNKNSISVEFVIVTIFGETGINKEVAI